MLTHTSTPDRLDDPVIWGVLPFRYHWSSNTSRWSLGSYDICFRNGQSSLLSTFFTNGNTLPTQRLAHSPHGGLFQSTMTQCIQLLSDPHHQITKSQNLQETFSTNGIDSFPSPPFHPSRRYSWLHIFPEGMIHQHPLKVPRYFKWGISRLILESEPCPDVVPMWIDGMQDVMSENRTWPRPVPRPFKDVSVTFGDPVDREVVLEPLRRRWRNIVERRKAEVDGWHEARRREGGGNKHEHGPVFKAAGFGSVEDEWLRYGLEAEELRVEVTLAVREEVLKVRRRRGLPDEDPKRGLAETWRREGVRREGEMEDGSLVKDM